MPLLFSNPALTPSFSPIHTQSLCLLRDHLTSPQSTIYSGGFVSGFKRHTITKLGLKIIQMPPFCQGSNDGGKRSEPRGREPKKPSCQPDSRSARWCPASCVSWESPCKNRSPLPTFIVCLSVCLPGSLPPALPLFSFAPFLVLSLAHSPFSLTPLSPSPSLCLSLPPPFSSFL